MTVSLADLLNEASLELSCVSGHEDLSRTVSWVHVGEINDPSPWLTRGVLLLTTGLFDRSAEELDTFFAALAESGIAAVGFGVGLTTDEIPERWVRAASARKVPLLRVPLSTPYIAVSEFVSRKIAEAQLSQVKRMLDVQQRLAYSAPSSEMQVESLDILARELGAAVLWHSSGGLRQIASEEARLSAGEVQVLGGEISRHAASGRRSSSVSVGRLFAHIASTAGLPIAVVRRSRYSPVDQNIIGSIATFIDLHRDEASLPVVSASLREQILTEAMAGRIEAAPRLFEIVLPQTSTCTVVRLGPGPDRGEGAAREPAAGLLLKAHLANALDTEGAPTPPLLCSLDDGFALVMPAASEGAIRDAVESFLRQETGNLGTWRAGISSSRSPRELLEMCGEAAHAYRVSAHRDRGRAVSYASVEGRDLARQWASTHEPAVFGEWRARLGTIPEAPVARLSEALRTFLKRNGAVERAAAELGIHRQTLHARLREAEQALEVSLDSPTDRALLWLALDSGALSAPYPATPGSPAVREPTPSR